MLGLIGTSVPGTLAYLTDMQEAVNRCSFTDTNIRIEEDFEPPDDPGPGTVISKSPRLINESEIPVYVRITAHFSNDQAENFCMPLEIHPSWSLHSDGYYYYDSPLGPGESTQSLFDQIEIREDADSDALVPFDLLIYAEAIQCYDMNEQEAWAFYEKKGLS